jgi:hypothetical protein
MGRATLITQDWSRLEVGTVRRTYISLLLAAGCDPAYVQHQVGHTDPTLTSRIYQQLLKRKRRQGVPRPCERGARHVAGGAVEAAPPGGGARLGVQLAAAGGLSGCEKLAPSVGGTVKDLQRRPWRRRVSDGTRTRDRLDHNQAVAPCGFGLNAASSGDSCGSVRTAPWSISRPIRADCRGFRPHCRRLGPS